MTERAYVRISIAQLRANPGNVRRDLGDLDELADSIRAQGVLQPLLIAKPHNGRSLVIDGHRRLAAAKLAGLQAVPCLIGSETGRDSTDIMLAAAMHAQLEPLDQARAFARLRDEGMTIAQIAARTGYSHATVSGRLLLIELPTEAQGLVSNGTLTLGQGVDLGKQIRASRSGSVQAGRHQPTPWFTANHRLSGQAASQCSEDHALRRQRWADACGECWEEAIRADERGEELLPKREIDEMAVQRAIDGDRAVTLTVPERELAVKRLTLRGMNDSQVAARLGITTRTVMRCRQRQAIRPAQARVTKPA